MCQRNLTGPYPCGHVTTTWDYCGAARARALLLRNNPLSSPFLKKKTTATPSCAAPQVASERQPADLTTACSRTCLTKPFLCCRCCLCAGNDDSDKEDPKPQVGWACARCGHVRCRTACAVWTECGCERCRGAACLALVLQDVGDDVEGKPPVPCASCREGGCVRETKGVEPKGH